MNNRYLYRAKRTDNGEWAEGHLITDEQNRENHFIGYVFGTSFVMPHNMYLRSHMPYRYPSTHFPLSVRFALNKYLSFIVFIHLSVLDFIQHNL